MVAALLGFSACNKMEVPQVETPSGEVVIALQGEDPEAKTVLSGKSVLWQSVDTIKVFGNADNAGVKFMYKSGTGASAQFTNKIKADEDPVAPAGSKFYAVYPYSDDLAFDGSKFTMTLPSDVDYVAGSFASGANPSIGRTTSLGGAITMKNLCGLVKLSLKGNSTIYKLTLTLDKPVSGQGTVGESADVLVMDAGASKSTTLRCASGVKLNATTAKDFYFVVPANNYSRITIDVMDSEGAVSSMSSTSAFTVNRAAIRSFNATQPTDGRNGVLEPMTEVDVDELGAVLEHEKVSVTSFNIKNQSDDDDASTSRDWNPTRREAVKAYIAAEQPAILCTQECEHRQKEWLLTNCSGYAAYGLGSDHGKDESGEAGPWYDRYDKNKDAGNYIFYRTDKYEALATGTYWLSSTPEKVSKFSSSNHYRCCSWVKLKDKSNNYEFYVFSTHLHQGFDSSDDSVRSRQLDVLYNYAVGTVNTQGLPMIICGDFNMTTTGSSLQAFKNTNLMQFARNVWNKEWDDAHKSFNAWGTVTSATNIDHILYKYFYKLESFSTNIKSYNGVAYMSDHYPINVTLEFSYQS